MCAARSVIVHPVLLRSYETSSATERDYTCHIWEAARATSAAPLFFEPVTLKASGATFVDGAMRLSNPIFEVLNEAERLFPGVGLRCIISVGTGWTDVQGLCNSKLRVHDVVKTCIDLSTDATNEAQKFIKDKRGRKLLDSRRYFRFDVDVVSILLPLRNGLNSMVLTP